MTITRSKFLLGAFAVLSLAGRSIAAPRNDLYACEGCEAALEQPPVDGRVVIASAQEPGERMILRGTVLHTDGRTPASGAVIYAHHTNTAGLYADGSRETTWSRRHGKLRAWLRTSADGRFEFDTIKPGVYPDRSLPAHVHLFIAETGRPPYWIDDVVFEGEYGVDDAYRARCENRGGSGIVSLRREGELWIAERNIVLEQHPA